MRKTRKISPKDKRKIKILNGIEKGMKEVKLFREGKITLKTLNQVLAEL